ncbi:hypothetical protein T484DRAFT_1818601, partial [Baffinella frigidus]
VKTVNPEWEENFEFVVSSDDRYNADLIFQCFDKSEALARRAAEWEETFEFAVSSDDRYNTDLIFQCFDKDVMGSDDDLGRFTIPVWCAFEEEDKPGEIELEVYLEEANVPGLHAALPAGNKPRGTLIEQMDAKTARDTRRVDREERAKVEAWEKGFEESARLRFNRASEIQLRKQLRRDAKIAAGVTWREYPKLPDRASEIQLRKQLRRDAKIAAGLDPETLRDSEDDEDLDELDPETLRDSEDDEDLDESLSEP